MLKKIKDWLYYYFAEKNWGVRREYGPYVDAHQEEHKKHRWKHWWLLVRLNWHYRVLRKTIPFFDLNFSQIDQHEKMPCGSESEVYYRPDPYHFVKVLLKYDVISFDIFDTLLLRPFQKPKDLFYIVGKRLKFPSTFTNFAVARSEAERQARDDNLKGFGNKEVNIYDIYRILASNLGISETAGIQTELETERDYLFANPYMKIVYDILKTNKKTIVLTSDMYIPHDEMEVLLKSCGYYDYEKLYVSCDYKCDKASGELFRRIKSDYPGKSIIHVGDNIVGDIKGSKLAGIDSRHYKNVHEIGKPFRADWMSSLVSTAYSGLVNAYIHNGTQKYSEFYEYGFIYGGLYVYGFCHWIYQKVKQEGIEKVIFLARDGDIYQKIFQQFYSDIPNEYVFWSRFASVKYLVEINKQAMFDRVIKHKSSGTLPIELGSVLKSFNIKIDNSILKKYGLFLESQIGPHNVAAIKLCLNEVWEDIVRSYDHEKQLTANEIEVLIGNAKKIAVVDVGWTGSGPIGFKEFVNRYVKSDCEIKCWMAAGSGSYGSGDYILPDYMDGTLEAYMFSPLHNRRNEQIHSSTNTDMTNNALFEFFTQARYPSYRGRSVNDGYEFDIPEVENYHGIQEVHQGIIDFCNCYHTVFSKDPYLYSISGFDAYRPFAKLALSKKYFEHRDVFRNIVFGYGISGDEKNQRIETIGARADKIKQSREKK